MKVIQQKEVDFCPILTRKEKSPSELGLSSHCNRNVVSISEVNAPRQISLPGCSTLAIQQQQNADNQFQKKSFVAP